MEIPSLVWKVRYTNAFQTATKQKISCVMIGCAPDPDREFYLDVKLLRAMDTSTHQCNEKVKAATASGKSISAPALKGANDFNN